MNHAQNFYAILKRTIADKIPLKAFDGPHSNGREPGITKHSLCPESGHLGEFFETRIGSLKETAGHVNACVFSEEHEMAG